MVTLPVLGVRQSALEKCVYCPKLCRAACPVSNAEPREALTPWGKMSAAWMESRSEGPRDQATASLAWACTGCGACSAACEHQNPVGDVLLDARGVLEQLGRAPAAARRAREHFGHHVSRTRLAASRVDAQTRTLPTRPPRGPASEEAFLVGCGYLRGAPKVARDAVDALATLRGRRPAVLGECCGLPLRFAGAVDAYRTHAKGLADRLRRYKRVFVLDPSCALTFERGERTDPRPVLFIEEVFRSLERLPAGRLASAQPVRWHEPCSLGRALRLYEAPRAILGRLLGRPVDELESTRDRAPCSGAGGLLPATMPTVARAIADERWSAHARAGGGLAITACAAGLRALRRRAPGGMAVEDIATWIARGLLDSVEP